MGRHTTEYLEREIKTTRERLDLYLAREKEMLSKDGVQLYTIGSRNLQRYQTTRASIQAEIDKLRKRLDELEGELAGFTPRRALSVTPHDW